MSLDLVKTATFATLHFGVGFGVTYLLTGSVAIATGVALIEPAVNTVVFFFHEKAWRAVGRRFDPRLGRGALSGASALPPGKAPAAS
jgi:uncharacterized membrane protein